jgi:hypothetical protein
MSNLKAGSCAEVVDQSGGSNGNNLRAWPVKSAARTGFVGVGGIVKLLHGSFTDEDGGIWWAVKVLTDPHSPSDVGREGWMAEFDPKFPSFVNLALARCP